MEEGCLGRASDGVEGDESAGIEPCLQPQSAHTYVFLTIEHEAAIELSELAEGHISIPHL